MTQGRTTEQDALRHDESAIRAELMAAGASFRGRSCKCPFHTDKNPSAGIFVGDDGSWHFKCQVCEAKGDIFDIRARVQKRALAEILAEYRPATIKRSPVRDAPRWFADVESVTAATQGCEAVYLYTNPQTRHGDMLVLRVRRLDGGKRFAQYRPAAGGGWEEKAPDAPRPIYNRIRLIDAARVVVVEGEKCVHALASVGIVGTTAPGGAGNAAHADWSPLAGKICVLWPDNDPPNAIGQPNAGKRTGIEHMKDVAVILQSLTPPATVLWLDPDELALPPKADVVDYITQYGGDTTDDRRRAVEAVLSTASSMGPAEDLAILIEDTIAGRRRALPFPYRVLTRQSRALMPGTVTVLAGDPGCGKSFMLLESAAYWHKSNFKVAIYELEDEKAYHLNRVLAQLEENADLIDPDWVMAHPHETRDAMARHRQFLDSFAPCITTSAGGDVKLSDLLKWVDGQAVGGKEIIVIDPVTAAGYAGKESWQEDRDFIIKAKAIVKEHGARLVLSSHPKMGIKKGDKSAPLHGLAGGAAYPRFAHTVLWITAPDKPRKVFCDNGLSRFNTSINRSVRLGKTRNGPGSNVEIGFNFGRTLKFAEQGAIDCEDDRGAKIEQLPPRRAPVVQPLQDPFDPEDLP